MEQKVIQIGSSLGVVIPADMARRQGIEQGQGVTPVEQENGDILLKRTISPEKKGNPALVAWAEDAVERYRPALEALKDK